MFPRTRPRIRVVLALVVLLLLGAQPPLAQGAETTLRMCGRLRQLDLPNTQHPGWLGLGTTGLTRIAPGAEVALRADFGTPVCASGATAGGDGAFTSLLVTEMPEVLCGTIQGVVAFASTSGDGALTLGTLSGTLALMVPPYEGTRLYELGKQVCVRTGLTTDGLVAALGRTEETESPPTTDAPIRTLKVTSIGTPNVTTAGLSLPNTSTAADGPEFISSDRAVDTALDSAECTDLDSPGRD